MNFAEMSGDLREQCRFCIECEIHHMSVKFFHKFIFLFFQNVVKFSFLNLEANFKIESEYIKRYLGELTPFQESCLVQLKKWMAEAHQGKVSLAICC